MGLADGVAGTELMSVEVVVVLESHGSSVEGLGGPLAVAVEAVAVSDAVSKAETLSRPVGGGNSVSGVDGNSSVEGLGAPLAVVSTVVEARVETRDLLVRSGKARMGLADGVLGVSLVAVEVVAVLESGDSAIESISIGLSAPLAVAGVELGPLLERSSGTRVGLADGVSGGELVAVHVVAVLKGGGKGHSVSDAVSVEGLSAPLANTVAVGSVHSGAGAVAVAGGGPGGEAGAAVVVGRGSHCQAGCNLCYGM